MNANQRVTNNTLQLPAKHAHQTMHNVWRKIAPWTIAIALFALWGAVGTGDLEMEMARAQSICEANGQVLTEVARNEFECTPLTTSKLKE